MTKALFLVSLIVFSSTWAKPVKRKDPMINPGMHGGDMKIRDKDRNAIPKDSQRWPKGVIPYIIDEDVSDNFVKKLKAAMKHISSKTCIQFVERTNQRDYVKAFAGDGCYADWGLHKGENELSLGDGCLYHGIVVHELGHTIGFEHEHNRSDRDEYIKVLWQNIEEENYDAFTKLKPHQERLLTPFDFESIMMYGQTSFAIREGLNSMEALDGRFIEDVTDKKYLSDDDIKRINMLYKCD